MFWIGCENESIWKVFQRNPSPPHHRTGWLFAAPGRNPASPIISSIRFNRTIQLAEKMCSLPNTSWHTRTNMHFSKHKTQSTIQLAEKMCSLPNTSPWHTRTNIHFFKTPPYWQIFFFCCVSIHFYISLLDLARYILYLSLSNFARCFHTWYLSR